MLILLLSACYSLGTSPCVALYEEACEACSGTDSTDLLCTCLENGTLESSDYPEQQDVSDDEAAYECASTISQLTYIGHDSRASCEGERQLLKEHEEEWCDANGFEERDGGGGGGGGGGGE